METTLERAWVGGESPQEGSEKFADDRRMAGMEGERDSQTPKSKMVKPKLQGVVQRGE